jgi:hypothetical protein
MIKNLEEGRPLIDFLPSYELANQFRRLYNGNLISSLLRILINKRMKTIDAQIFLTEALDGSLARILDVAKMNNSIISLEIDTDIIYNLLIDEYIKSDNINLLGKNQYNYILIDGIATRLPPRISLYDSIEISQKLCKEFFQLLLDKDVFIGQNKISFIKNKLILSWDKG